MESNLVDFAVIVVVLSVASIALSIAWSIFATSNVKNTEALLNRARYQAIRSSLDSVATEAFPVNSPEQIIGNWLAKQFQAQVNNLPAGDVKKILNIVSQDAVEFTDGVNLASKQPSDAPPDGQGAAG